LAAGLSPDPLGELKCFPRPSSRNRGVLLIRGKEASGREGRERDKEVEEGKGRGEGRERGRKGWEGICPLMLSPGSANAYRNVLNKLNLQKLVIFFLLHYTFCRHGITLSSNAVRIA